MISDKRTARVDWKRSYYEEAVQSEALRKKCEALRKDATRLAWLLREECVPDGIVGVEFDRYEYALQAAYAAGRDEPSDADCLDGLRMLIDAAMAATPAVR